MTFSRQWRIIHIFDIIKKTQKNVIAFLIILSYASINRVIIASGDQ